MTNLLRKISKIVMNKYFNQSPLYKDVNKQREIIRKIKKPDNNIERSYSQFKCQEEFTPFLLKIIRNCVSSVYIVRLLFNFNFSNKTANMIEFNEKKSAVFLSEGVSMNIIPSSLTNEFNIKNRDYNTKLRLDIKDLKFIFKELSRYIYQPFFLLKIVSLISMYSQIIIKNKPDAIIVHSEYSFASSALTEYCSYKNVKHINIMHGEKLYNIRDAFVNYHEFYVWDNHYKDLFIKLNARKDQFIIELPPVFEFRKETHDKISYDIKYYLGNEDLEAMIKIEKHIRKLPFNRDRICIRLHPRYSNQEDARKVFSNYVLEDHKDKDIRQSIMESNLIASLYSTVLYQAIHADKQVVVDDLTQVSLYEKLKRLDYIILSKDHLKLSDLIKD